MKKGVSDIDNWFPLGIGANLAYGLHTRLAHAHRCRLFEIEQDQLVRHWMYSLLRCKDRQQYKQIQSQFLKLVKEDPSLKPAANTVLEDGELLKFRDKLPEESEEPYDMRYESREVGTHERIVIDACSKPTIEEADEVSCVYLLRYRNEKQYWKESRITLKSFKGTVPAAHVTFDNKLHLAHYLTESVVRYAHYDADQKLMDEWYCANMGGPLLVHQGCVSDGRYVFTHQGTQRHFFANHIVTAIEWYKEALKIGTLAGLIFSCSSNTVEAVPNRVAVLSIQQGKAYQTLCTLVVDRLCLNAGRIIASRIVNDGEVILTLNKHGVLHVRCEGKDDYVYNPPNYVSCNIQHTMAHCKDALWVSQDASQVAILYPTGQVGVETYQKRL